MGYMTRKEQFNVPVITEVFQAAQSSRLQLCSHTDFSGAINDNLQAQHNNICLNIYPKPGQPVKLTQKSEDMCSYRKRHNLAHSCLVTTLVELYLS